MDVVLSSGVVVLCQCGVETSVVLYPSVPVVENRFLDSSFLPPSSQRQNDVE
jgi:hypothetical protein